MKNRLEFKKVAFTYSREKTLFQEISFSLESGNILGIIGKNGIGKTTFLKCTAGLLPWSKGNHVFNGEKILVPKMNFGYIPQAKPLTFSYDVEEFIKLWNFSLPNEWYLRKMKIIGGKNRRYKE